MAYRYESTVRSFSLVSIDNNRIVLGDAEELPGKGRCVRGRYGSYLLSLCCCCAGVVSSNVVVVVFPTRSEDFFGA